MARLVDRRAWTIVLGAAAWGCGERAPKVPAGPAAPPAAVDPRAEFEAVARALREGSNPYLGYAPVRERQALLARTDLGLEQRVVALVELARLHLQFGEIDESLARLAEAEPLVAGNVRARSAVLYAQGLAHLRRAEVENCVARHNRECCIFPLARGGLHTLREPALAARACFEAYLALQPMDLKAAWLMNVLAMALGDHPDGVPERYRIPPGAFASDADVGRFPDVAPALGLDRLNNCGGVVAEDLDGDRLVDLVTSSFDPSTPLAYYKNRGDGTFEERTAAARLDDQLGGLNLVGADYDGDGDVDLFVLRGAWLHGDGQVRNSLLRNAGDGTFTDVTRELGLAEPASPTQAAAWGDFDGDGDLDLYVVNESSSSPAHPTDFPAQLFRNDGERGFSEQAAEAGVLNGGFAKGVAAGDYDNDGDLDLYVSNIGPNRLFRNDGGLRFTDVARAAGVTQPEQRSFACWFFDYDNDGWLDLFVAAYQATVVDLARDAMGAPGPYAAPALYRNNRDGTFTDVAAQVGLDHPWLPMGANFGDVDNDGWLDVYLATGDPAYETLMPNVLLRNDGARAFQDVTTSAGVGHLQKGHGVAFADLDQDGDQDLFNQLGGFYPGDRFHNALFLNPGHGNRFLVLSLVGVESNRAAVGARIEVVVETAQGPRSIHRALGCVSSFGGSPLRQEIGLGDARGVASVTIRWPRSGAPDVLRDVPLDSWIEVREGSGTFTVLPYAPLPLARRAGLER